MYKLITPVRLFLITYFRAFRTLARLAGSAYLADIRASVDVRGHGGVQTYPSRLCCQLPRRQLIQADDDVVNEVRRVQRTDDLNRVRCIRPRSRQLSCLRSYRKNNFTRYRTLGTGIAPPSSILKLPTMRFNSSISNISTFTSQEPPHPSPPPPPPPPPSRTA